jgi:hypothetical protein
VTDAATTLLTVLAGLSVLALGLQGADLLTLAVEDAARGRKPLDTAPGRATRQFWSVIVPALAALLLAVGVDVAARMMLAGDIMVGIALVASLGLVLIGVVAAALLAQQREPVDDFALLARRLAEVPPAARPHRTDVDGWREELADLDLRHALRPGRRYPWLTWRLAPAVVPGVFMVVAILAAFAGVPGSLAWVLGAVVALAGGVVLGIAASRFAATARMQVARARAASRIEIVRLLQDLDRRSVRRVPGFGDRVARALAILREEQKPSSPPPRDR